MPAVGIEISGAGVPTFGGTMVASEIVLASRWIAGKFAVGKTWQGAREQASAVLWSLAVHIILPMSALPAPVKNCSVAYHETTVYAL